jgi:excisionase family DNA binding protein
MEPLLNMDEAASLLKLTRRQLYELTRNRSRCRQSVPIPMVRIGKRKMFRASSLNAWIHQLEDANRQPA